jgi:hypothetical protein
LSTDCTSRELEFQGVGRRRVVAQFDGGLLSSDGGSLLLGEVERRRGIVARLSECCTDHRDPRFTEHSVFELLAQRIFGLALGYEDLNDHDELSRDPVIATSVGREDPTGAQRRLARDQGRPMASSSTLNRLEWGAVEQDRYRKITWDLEGIDRLYVEAFLSSYAKPPSRIVLDLDATDDRIHGDQEGRFYHGYYNSYCYLPLYIFCGDHLLCARLRRSNIDASEGSEQEIERIVAQIRDAWPNVEILLRADAGFAREALMAWCEGHDVDYVFGLARNSRLVEVIGEDLQRVAERCRRTRKSQRLFRDFAYRTLKSWSRSRRVIGKAEHLRKGSNPRFIVTSLPRKAIRGRELYERIYCARGEMENRIKEQQLCLFADRTSARKMKINQLRLAFSSVAYLLLVELRRLGLQGTEMARARCDTLRLKFLKVAARIKISVRRIVISLPTAYPYRKLFVHLFDRLQRAGPDLA